MNPSPSEYLIPMAVQLFALLISSSLIYAEALILSVHLFGREHKIRKLDLIWGALPCFLIFPALITVSAAAGFYMGYTNPDSASLNYNDLVGQMVNLPVMEAASLVFEVGYILYAFFISLFLFRKERLKSAFVNTAICYAVHTIVDAGITDFWVLLSHDTRYTVNRLINLRTDSEHLTTLISLISAILVMLFYAFLHIRFVRRGKRSDLPPKYAVIISLTVILIHILISIPFLSVFTDAQSNRISRIMLAIFVPLMSLLIPVIFIIYLHRQKLKAKSISQANYLEAELDYISSYKKREEETRRFRLDIAEKLSYIDEMFRQDDIPSAQEKIRDMLGGIRALSPKYVTGDEMLDLIVAMKAAVMEESGMTFSYDGVIDGGLNMKPFDICGIFGNALDNAIEACRSVGKDTPLKINMNITRTPAFFLIKISNSCRPDVDASRLFVDGEVYTTKKDRSLHGIGTQNIKNAVESYGGMVKAKAENSVFELSITLPRD